MPNDDNMDLLRELRQLAYAHDNLLTDMFATTEVNQASALAWLLNEAFGERPSP